MPTRAINAGALLLTVAAVYLAVPGGRLPPQPNLKSLLYVGGLSPLGARGLGLIFLVPITAWLARRALALRRGFASGYTRPADARSCRDEGLLAPPPTD